MSLFCKKYEFKWGNNNYSLYKSAFSQAINDLLEAYMFEVAEFENKIIEE